MNREEAKELIPIIQAFTDGKKIRGRASSECAWIVPIEPDFERGWKWEIVPEPRVVYVNLYKDGRMYAYENMGDANEAKIESLGMELVAVKFVEEL